MKVCVPIPHRNLFVVVGLWALAFGAAFAQNVGRITTASPRISARQIFSSIQSAPTVASDLAAHRRMKLDPLQTASYFRSSTSLSIADFPIAPRVDGEIVLRRARAIVDARTKFVVAGAAGDYEVQGPELEAFTGTIKGENGSRIYLYYVGGEMIANIERADGSVFVLGPSLQNNAEVNEHVLVNANAATPQGTAFNCLADDNMTGISAPPPPMTSAQAAAKKLLEVEIAIETDSEFFTATGSDVDKAQAYALAIFSMVSAIYEEEVGVTVYVPWMKTWTNSPRDPYDVKGDGYALPDKVRPYWRDNYAGVQRDLGHVMTSIGFGGGGLGYPDGLCGKNGDYGFACSSVQSGHSYPTFAFTYDVYIVAHEIGHNFNSPHSHNCYWGAPIDTCIVDEGIQGGCLQPSQQKRPNPGSIMSYCGGTNADAGLGYTLRMTFLPQVAALMRQTAEQASCLTEPAAPRVILIKPHGQEQFDGKSAITINWISSKVNNIRLEYSTNAGTSWNSIQESLPASQETYSWTPPAICSNRMLVRLADVTNVDIADTSMITFTINPGDPSGLVAYYPFNGNGNDETICGFFPASGSAAPAADRNGADAKAFRFNGSTKLVAPKFLTDFSEISVSWWFNITTTNGVQTMVAHNWEEGGTFAVHVWNGTLGGAFWTNTPGGPFQVWGPAVQPNKWYHAVITYNGKVAKVYLNGIEVGSAASTNTLALRTAPLYIGSRGSGEYTNGVLDEVRIYRRALTLQDVENLYNEAGALPQAPGLVSPANGAANQPISVKLIWNQTASATRYHAQLATSADFGAASLNTNDSTLTVTSRDVTGLENGTTYHWRVAAYNETGKGPWSGAYSFTTGASSTLTAPALVSPPNGSTAVPPAPAVTLSWSSVPNALRYHAQLATSNDFRAQNIVMNDPAVTTTTKDVSGLAALTTYYWRVAATNDAADGPWSEPYSFTIGSATAAPGIEHRIVGLAPITVNAAGDRFTVRFGLPSAHHAELSLYNDRGEEVRVLYSGATESGTTTLDIDAGDLRSGAYYCKLQAGALVESRKLIIVK